MDTTELQVPYQHKSGKALSHFDRLYEKGLAWCASGIRALRHKGVNPFHVAVADRDGRSPVAVYYLMDHVRDEEMYWFEDDYIAACEAFRERITEGNHYDVMLFAAILTPSGDAEATFRKNDPFNKHGNICHWSDRCQSWQF